MGRASIRTIEGRRAADAGTVIDQLHGMMQGRLSRLEGIVELLFKGRTRG
jgi:hypothetical protein